LKNKKNILIVGGTGFIGYHLSKKSLKKGWNVTSISTKKPKKIRHLSKVNYVFCDITKKKSLKKIIKKNFDYVVNLGGHVDHSNKKKTLSSHYIGCKNLTEILLNNRPKSFVQMGSSIEYENVRSPHKENAKCNPKSFYGKAKLLSSLYLIKTFKEKKFPVTILRLYQAYGPRQDFNRFISFLILNCIKNKKFPCSLGNQFRDFIYIDDVIMAIIKSLTNKNARGQIFNIGSGRPKKIKNIIDYIKKKIKGGYPQYGKIKLRKDEVMQFYPNTKKVRKVINWKPQISFKKGIQLTIKFYNEYKI